jgi:flagellar capping protein FliD
MKIQKITMTAACMLMGGLTLAGCQGTSTNSASGSNATTQATSGASAAAVNVQSTNTAGSEGTATATPQPDSGSNSGSGNSGYSTCQAGDLKISLSGQNNVSSQVIQWVQLSNDTSTPCTMDGFAGVNLVGSASGKSDYSWSLERDSESYSKITLQAGEAAYFGIKYLPWASGDSAPINVAKIVLTPPNTTTSVTLPWSASVLLQDEATHPGTYLTPIALGTNG